ncbi:hypothetical protein TNCV_140801 [Trichonephila clavipes]|nr:hypothetical protein TNCV_140801 [Trichonephila clavipes]
MAGLEKWRYGLLSDSDLTDFQRLTWKEQRYLILGICQLKQRRSCTHEHLNQSELYFLYVNRADSSVVRLQLRSRHTCSKHMTAKADSDVVQSGHPIFDDFFQHLWPYIGNNTANVVFQMVKRLWLIRIDQ